MRLFFCFWFAFLSLTNHGQEVYISTSNSEIHKINSSLCSSTLIGSSVTDMYDIAICPNGKLYTISNTTIYELDTSDASVLSSAIISPASAYNCLVCDKNGTLYIAGGTYDLYTINPTNGSTNLVGNMGYLPTGDLAIYKDTMYLIASGPNLIKLDPSNLSNSIDLGGINIPGDGYGLYTIEDSCSESMYINQQFDIYTIDPISANAGMLCNDIVIGIITGAATKDTSCTAVGWSDIERSVPKEIIFYPNPTTGLATIMTDKGITGVEVYDVFGRPVPFHFNMPHSLLDIQGSPAGVYFVRVGDAVRKLVKK